MRRPFRGWQQGSQGGRAHAEVRRRAAGGGAGVRRRSTGAGRRAGRFADRVTGAAAARRPGHGTGPRDAGEAADLGRARSGRRNLRQGPHRQPADLRHHRPPGRLPAVPVGQRAAYPDPARGDRAGAVVQVGRPRLGAKDRGDRTVAAGQPLPLRRAVQADGLSRRRGRRRRADARYLVAGPGRQGQSFRRRQRDRTADPGIQPAGHRHVDEFGPIQRCRSVEQRVPIRQRARLRQPGVGGLQPCDEQ